MIAEFLSRAQKNLPVYITDVRARFSSCGTGVRLFLQDYLDEEIREFFIPMPILSGKSEAEKAFLREYFFACIYNVLSALGGKSLFLLQTGDHETDDLLAQTGNVFGITDPPQQRTGYGRCINVTNRILASLGIREAFSVSAGSLPPEQKNAVPVKGCETVTEHFRESTRGLENKIFLGMDVGGTDIKLALCVSGKLVHLQEYDWFPGAFKTPEEMLRPMEELVCHCGLLAAEKIGKESQVLFDGIGLSFPDVVIQNRIVGGETYKTRGMRQNPELNYEKEFRKFFNFADRLRKYCTENGKVCVINDGPMAAFSAAVEDACRETPKPFEGIFAHTLGTELGTGWIDENGIVPDLPMELYNFIIDLGSWDARKFPCDDIRSNLNFNTDLPGTLQKVLSQSGAFLSAYREFSGELFERGFVQKKGGTVEIVLTPEDMRKPMLEFIMQKCEAENPVCMELFRELGRALAVTWRETEEIVHPKTKSRILYGRMVKHAVCFNMLREGAEEKEPEIRIFSAGEMTPQSSLMKQLAESPSFTVAQFAQAVSAIYYSNYR